MSGEGAMKDSLSLPLSKHAKEDPKCPVFLENPDGSLIYGIPPGTKVPSPPHTPRRSDGLAPMDPALAAEVEYIFQRHEKLFLSLLVMELATEITFSLMYLYYAEYSVHEVSLVYHQLSLRTLWLIFGSLFATEITYFCIYYGLGFWAIWSNKRRVYRWFANAALVGILGQVMLAYMNKFNLLVFFLRLMAYVYAKFLRNLLHSLDVFLPVVVDP